MAYKPRKKKSKDNPYTLGFDENNEIYTITFKDNKNIIHKITVSYEVFKAFDEFELKDISQMHEYERHIEHSELYDQTLYHRAVYHPISIEDGIEQKMLLDSIKSKFNTLTETQKRRIKMYYFDDLNFKQIAELEQCDESSVRETIYKGIEKIKKNVN